LAAGFAGAFFAAAGKNVPALSAFCSAFTEFGPKTPSAVTPRYFCSALLLLVPNRPSAVTLSFFCRALASVLLIQSPPTLVPSTF